MPVQCMLIGSECSVLSLCAAVCRVLLAVLHSLRQWALPVRDGRGLLLRKLHGKCVPRGLSRGPSCVPNHWLVGMYRNVRDCCAHSLYLSGFLSLSLPLSPSFSLSLSLSLSPSLSHTHTHNITLSLIKSLILSSLNAHARISLLKSHSSSPPAHVGPPSVTREPTSEQGRSHCVHLVTCVSSPSLTPFPSPPLTQHHNTGVLGVGHVSGCWHEWLLRVFLGIHGGCV